MLNGKNEVSGEGNYNGVKQICFLNNYPLGVRKPEMVQKIHDFENEWRKD
jgi:hypothetical protein